MSTNEIHCQTCDYYFSGTTTFHIHLKSCEDSINKDPKNKYSCPVCNKQFRVLNNLERHEETSKHKKLIEWHKQRDDTLNNNFESDPNIKSVYVEIEKDDEKDDGNQIEETISPLTSNQNNNPQEPIADPYLDNLVKEREMALKSFFIQSENNVNDKNNLNDVNVNQEDNINLSDELKNTQSIILSNEQINDDNINADLIIDDDILNKIQETRFSKSNNINENEIEKEKIKEKEQIKEREHGREREKMKEKEKEKEREREREKIKQKEMERLKDKNKSKEVIIEPAVKVQYPVEFQKTPIWQDLSKLINNNDNIQNILKGFIEILSKTNINQFIIGVTFTIYNEDLKNKPSIRSELIKALISLYDQLNKMMQKGIMFWLGKNTVQCIKIMYQLQIHK